MYIISSVRFVNAFECAIPLRFFIFIFFSFQVILRVEVFVRVLIVTDSFIEFIDTW